MNSPNALKKIHRVLFLSMGGKNLSLSDEVEQLAYRALVVDECDHSVTPRLSLCRWHSSLLSGLSPAVRDLRLLAVCLFLWSLSVHREEEKEEWIVISFASAEGISSAFLKTEHVSVGE